MSVLMRLGIVACDVLKHEIEYLVKDDPDFIQKEYLEFSLHVYPDELRSRISEVIENMKNEVDGILLGYAICQSLENFTDSVDVPTVMIRGVDCIDAFLGAEEYAKEKKICTGTWFNSPGWAEAGKDGLIKEMHLDSMADEGIPPEYFLDLIFESYSRCLYIDTGIDADQVFLAQSKKFADELGFQHECRCGSLNAIKDAINTLKATCSMQ